MDDEAVDLGGLKPVSLPSPSPTILKPRQCSTCDASWTEKGDLVCRLNPPQVTMLALPTKQMVMTPQGPREDVGMMIKPWCSFPVVTADAWCRQWRPKE